MIPQKDPKERSRTDLVRIEDVTRREFMSSAIAAALLIACGSDADDEADPTATPGSRFPVSVTHKFGSTEITSMPGRVLSLGFNDHDALLALGVVPVAVRYWFSDEPVFPWAQAKLNGARPAMVNMPANALDFEAIAALAPDLIVAVYSGISQDDYARLSQIAPTIAQSGDFIDYGMPWAETTLHIGKAFAMEDEAREVVAGVEATIAETQKKYPEFAGAKAIVAATRPDGSVRLYAAQDVRTRAILSLGLEVPAEITALFGTTFVTDISGERISLLDTADVIIWRGGRAALDAYPAYWTLRVAEQGRHVFMEDLGPINDAFSFGTVLSMPAFIEDFAPYLALALDGDPSTNG